MQGVPPAEIHVCIAPTPAFLARVHVLAASLRRWGGALGQGRIVVTVSRDIEPVDYAALMPWSREHDIEWRWVPEAVYAEHGMYATALERFTYDFQAPFVVLLDADTLITGSLDDLPALVGDGMGGVTAHLEPSGGVRFADGLARRGSAFWADLHRTAGLRPALRVHEHTGWGLMDDDPDRRFCPPYPNLGMLAGSANAMRAVGAVIMDAMAAVDRFGETVFRCQLAVTLAVAATGVPWTALGVRFNFPNDARFWTGHAQEAADIRVLHYLRGDEIDREAAIHTAASLDALLATGGLSPVNAYFQDRLRDLRPGLGAVVGTA